MSGAKDLAIRTLSVGSSIGYQNKTAQELFYWSNYFDKVYEKKWNGYHGAQKVSHKTQERTTLFRGLFNL